MNQSSHFRSKFTPFSSALLGNAEDSLRIFCSRCNKQEADEGSIYDTPFVEGSTRSVNLPSPLTFIEVINKTFTPFSNQHETRDPPKVEPECKAKASNQAEQTQQPKPESSEVLERCHSKTEESFPEHPAEVK